MKTNPSPLLGVNIDHIATIRQARKTPYPRPLAAALDAEQGGADGITVHLREDRRHIQDKDVVELKEKINTRLNLEMALTDEMTDFALSVKPAYVCLVPEKRQELTTEGGLNVTGNMERLSKACKLFSRADIVVSLFIEPDARQIEAAHAVGAPFVELHTGAYANAEESKQADEKTKLFAAAKLAAGLGLTVNAGHGLHYENISPFANNDLFYELNIGHAIVARALFVGIRQAVRQMKDALASV